MLWDEQELLEDPDELGDELELLELLLELWLEDELLELELCELDELLELELELASSCRGITILIGVTCLPELGKFRKYSS